MENIILSNDNLILLIKSLHDPINRLYNTHLDYRGKSSYDNEFMPELNRLIELRKIFTNELLSRCNLSGCDL
jgi:hypothetical protein